MAKKPMKDERSIMEKGIAAARAVKGLAEDVAMAGLKKVRDQVPKIKNKHGEVGKQLEGREARTEKALKDAGA